RPYSPPTPGPPASAQPTPPPAMPAQPLASPTTGATRNYRGNDIATPYAPPAPASTKDRTTLWGTLGIVVAIIPCAAPVSAIRGVLSLQDAKRFGRKPTLAIAAFIAAALGLVSWLVIWVYLSSRSTS